MARGTGVVMDVLGARVWLSNRQLRIGGIVLALGLLVAGLGVMCISELTMPGYGYASQLVRSQEAIDSARAADLAEIAAVEAAVADEEFVNSIVIIYKGVGCPDPAIWPTLTAEQQATWHRHWQRQEMPIVGDSVVCYDP